MVYKEQASRTPPLDSAASSTSNSATMSVHAVLSLLLLLSYHRRLRMISEALELRVESGRINHSWCMCVVSHGNGGDMDGMYAGQSIGGWSHVGRCRSISRV